MPLYEYKCECGNEFEALKSIENRYDVICICDKVPKLQISAWGGVLMAVPFRVVNADGRVIYKTQTTERTPVVGLDKL